MTRTCWSGMARMAVVMGITACSEPFPALSWHIGFADGAASDRATVVEAEIREGSCAGGAVFSSRGVQDGSAAAPGALPAGHYGFFARARDEDCMWFAEACVERDLPANSAIELTLKRIAMPRRQGQCTTTADPGPAFDAGQRDGAAQPEPNEGPLDGGAEPPPRDAGGKDAGNGATAPRERPDAGPGANDEAHCRALDRATVACYDFANDLLDSSGFGNHASGQNAFEALGELRALRPLGRAISVADAPSLNMEAFTIEVWMRADALTNLSGDGDELSLLLDKDRQYTIGIDALGSPVMTIYRDRDRYEYATATDIALSVGTPYYLAFSYDGQTSRIFVDGRLVDSRALRFPVSVGVGGALFIGSGSPHATRPFDGLIDGLRISNVARAPAQICRAANKTLGTLGCE